MDRIAPTRRPSGPVRGYQRWRTLGFFHWEVPVEALRPLVPESLDIDTFEGRAYVGVVPFRMEGVRPRWAPQAVAFDFLETNVRTYVHVGGADPGVFFFSLDAESFIAVKAARIGWSLPYFYSSMQLEREGTEVRYGLQRKDEPAASLSARWRIGELLGASEPDTFEHWLVERYLLHVERKGTVYTGQVHHAPYPVQRAEVLDFDETLLSAAGIERPDGPPPICHYAEGVDVEIFDLAPRATASG